MKLEDHTSNLLLGVFVLREQLHTYIDILESQGFQIERHLGHKKLVDLLENKRLMLALAETEFANLMNGGVDDTDLFHPHKFMWSKEFTMCRGPFFSSVKQGLLKYDKMTMAWCYLFMTDKDIDVHHTGFLLTMIQYAKSGVDLLISE